jgi:nucleotide-binding universal stress UspA family protein
MEIPDLGTILCPVDLSEHSRAALYMAAGLANRPGSKLIVLHVGGGGDSPETQVAVRDFLYQTLPAWFAYRSDTQTILRKGDASTAILDTAHHVHAQLIVMGTRGRGALGRALMGSTAADVLRTATMPVMVVPPTDLEMVSLDQSGSRPHLGIVLVPVDLLTPSAPQLAWAGRISVGSDHHLLMLHVVPKGADPGHATERMRALGQSVASAHGFRLLVSEGAVADQICNVVLHDGIRFVVVGRSASAPGKLAYRILADTRAVVVMVP